MGQTGLLIFLACVLFTSAAKNQIINEWGLLTFNFPPNSNYYYTYRPENTVFTGLEVTEDRIFLAMPRLRAGVPATLAYIRRNGVIGEPLNAYPNWDFHAIGQGINDTCAGLTSVYRMRTDSCNRLWVLDSGVMTSIDDFQRICNPKLVIFDLSTDLPVRTIQFPRNVLRPASLFTNLVIDETIRGPCDSAYVYMTDTAAPGIVVLDSVNSNFWRFQHPSMYPDPDFSDYNVAGETFTLMDGVVGLTHSPQLQTLFFQPLATNRIFSVPTSELIKGPPVEFQSLPISLAGKKSSQGLGLALNPEDDTLFFSPVAETSVASWNAVTNDQKFLAYDPVALQFPAELRWVPSDHSLWLLSTRFQKFFLRTVSGNEINLRIIRIPIPRNRTLSSGFNFENSLYYK
ncbi:protein yellow isoform X2 [Aethina tumida]|nr:protein yellow isoform X2 [Aethina tumida]XP_049818018.1 protein yellow isoform X2 [Aethina tumida]